MQQEAKAAGHTCVEGMGLNANGLVLLQMDPQSPCLQARCNCHFHSYKRAAEMHQSIFILDELSQDVLRAFTLMAMELVGW